MSDLFSMAADSLFERMGEQVTYTAQEADPAEIQALISSPEADAYIGSSSFPVNAMVFSVRKSDVDRPATGDTVEYGGDVYTVIGHPELDSKRIQWTVGAEK